MERALSGAIPAAMEHQQSGETLFHCDIPVDPSTVVHGPEAGSVLCPNAPGAGIGCVLVSPEHSGLKPWQAGAHQEEVESGTWAQHTLAGSRVLTESGTARDPGFQQKHRCCAYSRYSNTVRSSPCTQGKAHMFNGHRNPAPSRPTCIAWKTCEANTLHKLSHCPPSHGSVPPCTLMVPCDSANCLIYKCGHWVTAWVTLSPRACSHRGWRRSHPYETSCPVVVAAHAP